MVIKYKEKYKVYLAIPVLVLDWPLLGPVYCRVNATDY